jgi:phosphonate transport system permease protein
MDAALTLPAIPPAPDPVAREEAAFMAARWARRRATLLWGAVLLACLYVSALVSEVSPETLAAGAPRIGEYFSRILPTLRWETLFSGVEAEGSLAFWFYRLDSWAWLIFETSQMALLATVLGGGAGFLLCFAAARNLAPSRTAFHLARRSLELCRTVPDIVFALIFVWAVGVGPLAGILAIALHTAGALGKLFAEVAENADPRPLESLRAAGANWPQAMRYAVLPQVAPNFLSYALLRFEINVRGASVIGFVGAGGIGQELYQVIAFNYYEEISAIIVLIILTVASIDLLSERLRRALAGHA